MKENFGLYLILTDPIAGYETCAQAAVDCGARYLQLRMKNVSPTTVLKTARALRAITRGSNTLFIINDDLTVAIESDADGIHLGQDDLSITQARQKWATKNKIFGLSTHNLKQIKYAEQQQPDYIGIGPIFPTPTKSDAGPALGASMAGQLAQITALTSVAIGGINTNNLPTLLTKGTHNFCVVRAVNTASNPILAIRQLQDIWKTHVF